MYKAILFDLDGTLLPMDNDAFTKCYFQYLAQTAAKWGYTDSKLLVQGVWDGVKAMVMNTGDQTNFDVFWDCFCQIIGTDCRADIPKFNTFYDNEFHLARRATAPTPLAKKAVATAREKADYVILATNPLFPANGDATRLSWIDLKMDDFDLVTDYTNSCHCKPNPAYYQDILDQFSLQPSECLMIGNDVQEDYEAASALGISVYLIDDYLIQRKDAPIPCPHGSYDDMIACLQQLS